MNPDKLTGPFVQCKLRIYTMHIQHTTICKLYYFIQYIYTEYNKQEYIQYTSSTLQYVNCILLYNIFIQNTINKNIYNTHPAHYNLVNCIILYNMFLQNKIRIYTIRIQHTTICKLYSFIQYVSTE